MQIRTISRLIKINKIKKSEKAQTAVEFILIVGAFVLISVILMPKILSSIELNKAIAAARDGAEFAIAMRAMGYDSPSGNITGIPVGVIKLKNITLERPTGALPATCNAGKMWYRLRFYVYAPSYITSNSSYTDSIEGNLKAYVGDALYRAFYGTYNRPGGAFNAVNTDRYCFTIAVNFISY